MNSNSTQPIILVINYNNSNNNTNNNNNENNNETKMNETTLIKTDNITPISIEAKTNQFYQLNLSSFKIAVNYDINTNSNILIIEPNIINNENENQNEPKEEKEEGELIDPYSDLKEQEKEFIKLGYLTQEDIVNLNQQEKEEFISDNLINNSTNEQGQSTATNLTTLNNNNNNILSTSALGSSSIEGQSKGPDSLMNGQVIFSGLVGPSGTVIHSNMNGNTLGDANIGVKDQIQANSKN